MCVCVLGMHTHKYILNIKLSAHFLCCEVLKCQDIGVSWKSLQNICCAIPPSVSQDFGQDSIALLWGREKGSRADFSLVCDSSIP